ncbi:hypothetical protein JHK87_041022 [Glycine soja]|nr:hypothetical protein JHK87_041022 [Glycine soja]
MATLNLFSQPWQPTISPSFCCSNTNNNNNVVYAYHNHNSNSNNSKLHLFSNSRQFSVLSQLSTNSSKSGSGSSWLQNSSFVAGIEYRKRPLYSVFPTKPAQVSSVEDLYEFICSGPLLDKIGITQEQVAESIDNWLLYGRYLCRLFQLNELYLTEPQKARIYHYYVPVFLWCEQQIAEHQSKFKDGEDIPPLVLLKADCLLMMQSAFNGRGDRADPSRWPEVEGPMTVVLFEGWMLGFKPLPVEAVKVVDPQLETVNKNLEAYYDAWDKYIKSWIVIKIKDPNCVFQWRLQAEIAMREAGNPGMTDDEVRDFVSRYLPAYYAYLPTLYSEGPNGSDPQHLLTIEIDEGRNPILAT